MEEVTIYHGNADTWLAIQCHVHIENMLLDISQQHREHRFYPHQIGYFASIVSAIPPAEKLWAKMDELYVLNFSCK